THGTLAQTISKVFTPDTIGPGSVSTITITITNPNAAPVEEMDFTDTLPASVVTIANPANASTDCGGSAILSAPVGEGTITFSDGKLGAFESCTVVVDVTSNTSGVHTNPAITLTYSGLDGDPPTSSPVDLTVDTSLPGFSKSFSPSSIPMGGSSTLTFTIDNSANGSAVLNLEFTDNLPTGMVIANLADSSTTCGTTAFPPTFTAVPGTSVIILDANGIPDFPAVSAGSFCTVTVDVTATSAGNLDNFSGELLADSVTSGKANATLVANSGLALSKSFTDDPVPPGGTVALEFTIENFDRNFSATDVGFTDDLGAALTGLTFSSLTSNSCGGTVNGVGTTTIDLNGGTVAPQAKCIILANLSVPATSAAGVYTNTTGAINGTVDGSPITGNVAADILFVAPIPLLTKEFLEVGT
ncbi:MAG: DUF11 domain-containing protein, partial [Gammaproteobacteria bacterium]|nr:DUF11 domain-containing protein [Gammaproteobacteria bacterium]